MAIGLDRIACCALLALSMLSGCATRTYRADASPPDAALTTYQAQVAIGECVFRPPGRDPALAGAVATALASGAIAQGVNYLGRAIEEAAKATNDRAVASRNVEVTAQTFGPCVQVVRGWFHRGFVNAAQQANALGHATRTWGRSGAGSIDRSEALRALAAAPLARRAARLRLRSGDPSRPSSSCGRTRALSRSRPFMRA